MTDTGNGFYTLGDIRVYHYGLQFLGAQAFVTENLNMLTESQQLGLYLMLESQRYRHADKHDRHTYGYAYGGNPDGRT